MTKFQSTFIVFKKLKIFFGTLQHPMIINQSNFLNICQANVHLLFFLYKYKKNTLEDTFFVCTKSLFCYQPLLLYYIFFFHTSIKIVHLLTNVMFSLHFTVNNHMNFIAKKQYVYLYYFLFLFLLEI